MPHASVEAISSVTQRKIPLLMINVAQVSSTPTASISSQIKVLNAWTNCGRVMRSTASSTSVDKSKLTPLAEATLSIWTLLATRLSSRSMLSSSASLAPTKLSQTADIPRLSLIQLT